jgi:hypothetical protein
MQLMATAFSSNNPERDVSTTNVELGAGFSIFLNEKREP